MRFERQGPEHRVLLEDREDDVGRRRRAAVTGRQHGSTRPRNQRACTRDSAERPSSSSATALMKCASMSTGHPSSQLRDTARASSQCFRPARSNSRDRGRSRSQTAGNSSRSPYSRRSRLKSTVLSLFAEPPSRAAGTASGDDGPDVAQPTRRSAASGNLAVALRCQTSCRRPPGCASGRHVPPRVSRVRSRGERCCSSHGTGSARSVCVKPAAPNDISPPGGEFSTIRQR
jgi:hypothetical protein